MKKIYVLSFASLLAYGSLNAQTPQAPGKPIKGTIPKKKIERIDNSNRSVHTFYTDYEAADRSLQNTAFGYENYFQFITDANTAYGTTVNSALYPVVAFYDLNDSYGLVSGSGMPETVTMASGTSLTIDSVFAVLGHYNSTGAAACTLRVKVVSLDASNRPTTTVLFTKDVAEAEFNPGASAYNFITTWGTNIGFTLPVGVTKYGVQLEYLGAIADTMGFIYGAVADYNACGSTGLEAYDPAGNPVPGSPVVSSFDDNSLIANAMYFSTYGLLPSAGGADFYIDCDGSGGITGTEVSLYQNWAIWTRVTANVSATGIDENSIISGLEQNVPNPFDQNTTINYTLAQSSEVTFTVTDLSGKVVLSQNYGKLSGGRHTINITANNLESGVYYYTVTAGNAKSTRKMVVTK